MRKLWIMIILFVLGYWFYQQKDPISQLGPGVLAPHSPVQERYRGKKTFKVDDYTITPLATFQLEALVLGTKKYRSGREADLSPVDFALGWGPMSDTDVLKTIRIRQSGRWYRFRYENCPISKNAIINHSANMHLIPASDAVRLSLKAVHKGERITLEGYLVTVQAKDGWRWKSSLTRSDTGNHSCELIWVERLQVSQPKIGL